MQASTFNIQELPENTILTHNNHRHKLSSFFEVHAQNFEFENYDHGSKQLKSKYKITKKLYRYFNKRMFLFKKFQEGIQIDEESWYSVIPETVSDYLLKRLKGSQVNKIFEPFCGVGGMAVHLIDQFTEYFINDIDPNKLEMLFNNLEVYNKCAKVGYFNNDFLEIVPFSTDAILVCPPWGGIDIKEYAVKDLDKIMSPKLSDILNHAKQFSQNIMLQMPKNTNLDNFIKILLKCNIKPIFTIEKIMTNNKISQLFIYLGSNQFTKIKSTTLENTISQNLGVGSRQEKKKLKKNLTQNWKDVTTSVYKKRFLSKSVILE